MQRAFCLVLILLLLLTPAFGFASAPVSPRTVAKITQVRWDTYTDGVTGTSSIRLSFDVSDSVQVTAQNNVAPLPQLVVNIIGAVPEKIASSINLDTKIADKINITSSDGQNSKITIDLPVALNDGDYKILTLPGDLNTNKPFRVVVDINKPTPPAVFNFTSGLKGKVIALDPGHGGSDVGAVGPDNIQEKTVTLAVALRVKDLLEQAGAKVYLTRNDDRDVYAPDDSATEELGARVAVGNENKVDVFVDIHANYFGNPKVSGTGTYYYLKSSYDKLLAQSIQDSLVSADGLNDRGIYAANFYVLKHTLMPAVLIELGFLSNPNEEKQLNTPQFQQKLAQGIVNGLDSFFNSAAQQGGGN
ncbi:MAG: amiC 1 [Firmicutes bacterium]|nr:amiC 1 [Bacillota bacterium]